VIRIKNLALSLRTQSKVKIRQPLSTLYVRPKDQARSSRSGKLKYVAQILKKPSKHLVLIDDEKRLVKVRLKPDAKKIGSACGKGI
jgi:hypothetical protein